MKIPLPVTGAAAGPAERGRWLRAVHLAWLGLPASTLALFVAALPARYTQLAHPAAPLGTSLGHFGIPINAYAAISLGCDALYVLVSVLLAGLLIYRRPDALMALFVSVFFVSLAAAESSTINALALRQTGVNDFTVVMSAFGYIGLGGLFYLFPDGRFVPRWTWMMLTFLAVAQVPFNMPDTSPYNPNNWPDPFKMPLLLGIFGTMIFSQIYRYRRVSGSVQRQQTKWVVYGATAAIVLMFVARSGDHGAPLAGESPSIIAVLHDPLLDVSFLLIPLSIGVSVLQYRLWDIDVIINRTLVYGGLTAGVVGLYVLIVGYLGTVLRTGDNLAVSLVATGTVAVLFQYLREHLQRGVNRLMYGERDDPYAALSGLGKRLEAALAPYEALPTIVETIAQALKLPYVAIALRREDASVDAAMYGEPTDNLLTLPLRYGVETVGELILAPRAGESSFSSADRRLLADLARQAGVAVSAVRLTADLQQSRERLVTAREEERRRLRRDLHDGLGPALGAFSLKAGAARNVLPHDQATADALLAELIGDIESAVADIRGLVYNLRPPALDDLGLVGAIRSAATQYDSCQGTSGLEVRVEAPNPFPQLPAAVEVAAYRIAQEALANVARHAQAHTCTVCLTPVRRELRLKIDDDGTGIPPGCPAGVGLLSMSERAEELGGSCVVEPRLPGGTSVVARLPCALVGSAG